MPSSTPVSIQLRLGRADDAAAIRALTRQAYAPWVAVIGREPLPVTVDYVSSRPFESTASIWPIRRANWSV